MGVRRFFFLQTAMPFPSALWTPALRAMRGERGSADDSGPFSVAWAGNSERICVESLHALTYLCPGPWRAKPKGLSKQCPRLCCVDR